DCPEVSPAVPKGPLPTVICPGHHVSRASWLTATLWCCRGWVGVGGPHVIVRKDGKTGSRRAGRGRAGSRRGRRGRPLLPEPVLGAAEGERRDRPGVRGVLLA